MREIFLLQDDNTLLEMKEELYDSEDLLQSLLEDYPKLLAGSQINPDSPRKWILIKREMGIPDKEKGSERWAVDHLFLDQEAVPTLVEVKRSTDTRTRREVVAQMLDYAANSVQYWEIEDIIESYHEDCLKKNIDPDERLLNILGTSMRQDDFWDLVNANLKQGKIRMLFVADIIPPELQKIVEFLNEQMNPAEVLAIEVKQYTGQNLKTLVSRVVGQTMKAVEIKASRTGGLIQWNKELLLEQVRDLRGEEIAEVVDHLISWCEDNGYYLSYGRGSTEGSVHLGYESDSGMRYKFFMINRGLNYVWFEHIMNYPPFDNVEKRQELFDRLKSIKGMNFKNDRLDTYLSSELNCLIDYNRFKQFCDVYDWIIKEIRENSQI